MRRKRELPGSGDAKAPVALAARKKIRHAATPKISHIPLHQIRHFDVNLFEMDLQSPTPPDVGLEDAATGARRRDQARL